jgi:hypothetical protein
MLSGLLSSQFPQGFPSGQLPGSFGAANFANFRPQYSVPGQAQAQQGNYPGKSTFIHSYLLKQ